MEIKQLKAFLAVARLLSFSQAAQDLSYAQSTITGQIQSLERELDVRLFERLGHSVTLTGAGRDLLPFARQIVRLSEEAGRSVARAKEIGGTLSIGTVESLCVSRLPRILKAYRARYPQVELALKFGCTSEFYASLRENTIDIAFLLEKPVELPDYSVELSHPEPMALFSGEGDAVASGPVHPADLNGKTLILTEPGCSYRRMFEGMLQSFAIKPQSVIETGNVLTIKQLAINGMGVTLLPVTAAEQELAEGKLVRLDWRGPAFTLFTQVVRHKSKWMSPPLAAFLALLHEMEPL